MVPIVQSNLESRTAKAYQGSGVTVRQGLIEKLRYRTSSDEKRCCFTSAHTHICSACVRKQKPIAIPRWAVQTAAGCPLLTICHGANAGHPRDIGSTAQTSRWLHASGIVRHHVVDICTGGKVQQDMLTGCHGCCNRAHNLQVQAQHKEKGTASESTLCAITFKSTGCEQVCSC